MATSYISANLKTQLQGIIDNVHETFARTITVYEEGERVLIAASSTYNNVYGKTNTGGKSVSRTSVSHSIKARIQYINAKDESLSDGQIDSQPDIDLINGSVKITVDESGFAILKEAKRCEFEGRKYEIVSKGSATGILGPQYYHFFLKPLDE
jgi:hypothetical protein|tara:strand:+ start:399 stop:857 length:459 start_codon:yes stop_codon:yes gene_type:complete